MKYLLAMPEHNKENVDENKKYRIDKALSIYIPDAPDNYWPSLKVMALAK